jgi:23S rRNA (guanosine2251-2'-O)-methyltransferase
MVDSSRRRTGREVLTNHNRCWIWGRHVVLATLRAGRWPILELLVGDRADDALWDEAVRLAKATGVQAIATDDASLTKACRSGEHQGMAARMAPFPYLNEDNLIAALPGQAMLVVLDRLQDPFNFGAIIRSASTLGINGIIVGDHEQVDVNSQVARSSVGAVNHIPLTRSSDLIRTVDTLKNKGFQIVAASERADIPLYAASFQQPTVAVIGNEGRGIRPELVSRCDCSVSIPMSGEVGSLNAAVAAGILFYEMRRQQLTTTT